MQPNPRTNNSFLPHCHIYLHIRKIPFDNMKSIEESVKSSTHETLAHTFLNGNLGYNSTTNKQLTKTIVKYGLQSTRLSISRLQLKFEIWVWNNISFVHSFHCFFLLPFFLYLPTFNPFLLYCIVDYICNTYTHIYIYIYKDFYMVIWFLYILYGCIR